MPTNYVPTTKVDVSYNTSHSPKRKLGSTIASDDQFGFEGALTADISVDCIIQTGLAGGFDFLADANQGDYVSIRNNAVRPASWVKLKKERKYKVI